MTSTRGEEGVTKKGLKMRTDVDAKSGGHIECVDVHKKKKL